MPNDPTELQGLPELMQPDPEWKHQKPSLSQWILPILRLFNTIAQAPVTPSVLTATLHQHHDTKDDTKFFDCLLVTTITGDQVHVWIDPEASHFSLRCPTCGCPAAADPDDLRFVSQQKAVALVREHRRNLLNIYIGRNDKEAIRALLAEEPSLAMEPNFVMWAAAMLDTIDGAKSETWNEAVDIKVNEQLTKDGFTLPEDDSHGDDCCCSGCRGFYDDDDNQFA